MEYIVKELLHPEERKEQRVGKEHQRGRDHAYHLLFTFMKQRDVPMSCIGGGDMLR